MVKKNKPIEVDVRVIKELYRQEEEKRKRASELIDFFEETLVQLEDKDKRLREQLIENKVLRSQNDILIARVAELLNVKQELIRLENEKEKQKLEAILYFKDFKTSEEYSRMYLKGLEKSMYVTSHSIRKPITNILGLVNRLESSPYLHQSMRLPLSYIKESAQELDRFTREMASDLEGLRKRRFKYDNAKK